MTDRSLSTNLGSIRDRVYRMFLNVHDWAHFSNHTASEGTNSDSLESIHDTMHMCVTFVSYLSPFVDIMR